MSAVKLLNFMQRAQFVSGHEVDGDTLTSESTATATSDTANVVLWVGWEIIVDNKRDLLDVDRIGEHVGSDQDVRARKELPHTVITLGRVQVTVYSRDSKVAGSKLIG
jgi:hypothetical protein